MRLLGFPGFAHGVDVSPGMIKEARKRQVFDALTVANANAKLALPSERFDLVILTGAMELLNPAVVLAEVRRVLLSTGQLWASFQADSELQPTSHQNIQGLTENEVKKLLSDTGFSSFEIEFCKDAFYTPKQGVMVPVPYYFVNAR